MPSATTRKFDLVLYGATKRDVGLMDTSSSEKAFSSVWDRMKNWFKEFF